jgi:ankyrin repeat protein
MASDEDGEMRSARVEEESTERSSLPSWLVDENGEVHVPETLEDGSTALHWAALANRPDVARAVLAAGAAVDARDKDSRTPLILAVRLNNVAVMEALLQGGAPLRSRDKEGFTALLYAVGESSTRGDPTPVTKLLLDAAGHSARELIAKEGALLLAINAHKRNAKLLNLLLSHGANLHARAGPHQRQALHFAARWGCDLLIGPLLAAGADLHAVDDDGMTALQLAVANDHRNAMIELLAFGADMFAHAGKSIPAHDLAPRGGKARAALARASHQLWEADPAAYDRKWEEWYGQQGPWKSFRYCLQNGASCSALELAGSVLLPPLLLAAAVTLVLWLLGRGGRRRRGRRQRSAGAALLACADGSWQWLMALPAVVAAVRDFINDTLFPARAAPAPEPEQQPRPPAAQASTGARRRRNAGAGGRTRVTQQPQEQPADRPAPIPEASAQAEPATLEDAVAEPCAAEPAATEPASKPSTAEPSASEPSGSEPSATASKLESAVSPEPSPEPRAEADAVVQTAKAPEPAVGPEAFPFLFPVPVPADDPAAALPSPPTPELAPPATPLPAPPPPPPQPQPEPPSPPSSPPPPQQHEPEPEPEEASGPQCAVCFDKPLQGIFIPCGHMAACVPCGGAIMRDRAVCPICSTPSTNFQRFFVAGA